MVKVYFKALSQKWNGESDKNNETLQSEHLTSESKFELGLHNRKQVY
jgi:hypothetical protein